MSRNGMGSQNSFVKRQSDNSSERVFTDNSMFRPLTKSFPVKNDNAKKKRRTPQET